jgi:hypothetical protein
MLKIGIINFVRNVRNRKIVRNRIFIEMLEIGIY